VQGYTGWLRRVIVDGRVEPGVIAKRPLGPQLPGLDVALKHKINIRRHFQIHGLAPDELHGFFPEKAREQDLIQTVRQRRRGGERVGGVAPEGHGHRHPLAAFVVPFAVAGRHLVHLPVHAGGLTVVHLHPVHAQVAFAGVGVAGVNAGERDEAAAVLGPALQNGQIEQGGQGLGRHRLILRKAVDHVLARAVFDVFGPGVEQVDALTGEFPGGFEVGGRLGLEDELHLLGQLVHGLDPQRHGHAPPGAHGVHRQGVG
jgi:hypothetical protein